MDPLHRVLELESAKWELKQQQRASANLGRHDRQPGEVLRSYAVVEAAKGTITQKCFEQVELLLHNEILWENLLDCRSQTMRHRHLAFEMLSNSECVVFVNVKSATSRHPLKTFLALVSPKDASQIQNADPHLQDPWIVEVVRTHADLTGEVAPADLQLHAKMMRLSIVHMEN